MGSKYVQHSCDPLQAVSRRGFLAGAAAWAAVPKVPVLAQQPIESPLPALARGSIVAYIGTYTPNGQGIYLYSVNPSNGALTLLKVFLANNPSWIALDPQKKYLYAANEISDFRGTPNGAVSAYAVNPSNGDLRFLNMVSSRGSGPAHLSVDPSGRYVLVANYGGGNVAVLPIVQSGPNKGFLGDATDVKQDANTCTPAPCPVGPTRAQNAPPGSFAISGHDAPHAHMIQTDPSGRFAIANDLGLDLTIIWKFNNQTGKLSDPNTVPSSPGAGPRHFAFHPNGRWFYSLNEEASTITFMIWNGNNGTLNPVQEISTLPVAFKGTNFTSEIVVSNNGRFVYAANRLHDTIAVFSIDGTGGLTREGERWTRGDYPRNFNFEPNGNFMYVCNHRGDSVTTFRVDPGSGNVTFTGQYTAVGSPACIIFLTTT